MIKVEGVTKRYGSMTAVRNISFEVAAGEIVGFLGPNGAGKTTTMRILTGFLPPTEGTAEVAGHSVLDEPIEVKRHIGYLPEIPPVYPEMDVDSYLEFVARLKGIPNSRVAAAVDAALAKTSIGHVRRKLIGKLSKGYKQRVGLAQALIHNPKVLILDEPTAGLDPAQIREVRELVKSLAGDHTIILSSHILSEVSDTCGRVIIISEGSIVATDTPANLVARLQGGGAAVELEIDGPAEEVQARLAAVEGVLSVSRSRDVVGRAVWIAHTGEAPDIRKRLAQAIVQSGWGLYGLKQTGMSLEDIFLKLTAAEKSAAAAPETVDTVATQDGAE
jgi:ABC-2 type transport system ATP-binding protein